MTVANALSFIKFQLEKKYTQTYIHHHCNGKKWKKHTTTDPS